jgi:hypothetical protein
MGDDLLVRAANVARTALGDVDHGWTLRGGQSKVTDESGLQPAEERCHVEVTAVPVRGRFSGSGLPTDRFGQLLIGFGAAPLS